MSYKEYVTEEEKELKRQLNKLKKERMNYEYQISEIMNELEFIEEQIKEAERRLER